MKKILFIFLISNYIAFSQSNLTNISNNEIKILIKEFNVVLNKYYPNQKLSNAYKSFLEDLSKKRVNPKIINEENTLNSFLKFKKTSNFYNVWKNNEGNDSKKNIINYESNFYKNLVENCKDKNLQKMLIDNGKTFVTFPDTNPFMIVSVYSENLKDQDYNLEIIQELICITFYYDIMEQFTN